MCTRDLMLRNHLSDNTCIQYNLISVVNGLGCLISKLLSSTILASVTTQSVVARANASHKTRSMPWHSVPLPPPSLSPFLVRHVVFLFISLYADELVHLSS